MKMSMEETLLSLIKVGLLVYVGYLLLKALQVI